MAEYKIIKPCVFQGKRYLPNEIVPENIITAKSIFGLINMGLIEKVKSVKADVNTEAKTESKPKVEPKKAEGKKENKSAK